MAWNDGYFDLDGNPINEDSEAQEVFDGDGNSVGYYEHGAIRDHNGTILAECPFDEESISTMVDKTFDFFDPFKPL